MIWPYQANIDDPDQLKNKKTKTTIGEVVKNKLVEPDNKVKENRAGVVETEVNLNALGTR